MAVEYVDGHTLRSLLRQPFPIPDFLAAARQMAEALSVAHTAGIVHRDIKADNIMLRADG